jgi:hypothetical protein
MTLFLEDGDQRTFSNYYNVFKGISNLGQFSGVLVTNDLVLTVAHSTNYLQSSATFTSTFSNKEYKGQAVYLDEYNDFGIYQLDNPIYNIAPVHYSLETLATKANYDYVKLIGFHKDHLGKQTEVASTVNNDISIDDINNTLFYDLDAVRGSSGGGLFDENNNLIGINCHQSTNYNYGSSLTADLLETIKEFDLLYNYVNPEDTKNINRYSIKKNGAHFYTTEILNTQELLLEDTFIQNEDPSDNKIVYELVNKETGSYLYTSSLYEIEVVERTLSEFDLTGNTFQLDNSQTIYRLFNPENGHHFYTQDKSEAQSLDADGWNWETNL